MADAIGDVVGSDMLRHSAAFTLVKMVASTFMPGRSTMPSGSCVEDDLHRDALHHLDEVAGGVFRRQQAQARAGGAGDGIDVAVDRLAVHIDLDFGPLAGRTPASWVSLKFAVTQTSCSGTTSSSAWPG